MAPQTSPVVIGIVTHAEAIQTFLREHSTGHIRGESLIGEAACAAFLERYCRPFGLKQFRAEARKQLHLSVAWSRVDCPGQSRLDAFSSGSGPAPRRIAAGPQR